MLNNIYWKNFFIDSFANATKKAYKAEETSHLSNSDSDLETYCTRKRQKKLSLRYQSNSDDEDVALEKQHVHSTKRTKHSVLPSFPEYEGKNIYEHIKQRLFNVILIIFRHLLYYILDI